MKIQKRQIHPHTRAMTWVDAEIDDAVADKAVEAADGYYEATEIDRLRLQLEAANVQIAYLATALFRQNLLLPGEVRNLIGNDYRVEED